ncbi:MAG: ribosome-binding factor A [Patescibacteria group bacterium]
MSIRTDRINELIRQQFNVIVLKEIEFPREYLVTVEKVDTAPDLKNCTIWLSVLPITYRKAALDLVNSDIFNIQSLLFKKLHLKFVPKIAFKIDTSEEKADRIFRILDKQKKSR